MDQTGINLRARGLAVVLAPLAFVIVALFSQGAASADVLCKNAPNKAGECLQGGIWGSGTNFTLESTNVNFHMPSGWTSDIQCGRSYMTIGTTSSGSNTAGVGVSGKVGILSFQECRSSSGISCSIGESSGYKTSITATSAIGSGSMTFQGPVSFPVSCGGSFYNCYWNLGLSGTALDVVGGNPAVFTANEEPMTLGSGVGCGVAPTFSGQFRLTGANTFMWPAYRTI
jgi:hypothetical protein